MFIENQNKTALVNIDRCDGIYISAPGAAINAYPFTPDDHKDKYRIFADQQGSGKVLGYFNTEKDAQHILDFITTCVVKGGKKTIAIPSADEAGGDALPSFLRDILKKEGACDGDCEHCGGESHEDMSPAEFLEKLFKGGL